MENGLLFDKARPVGTLPPPLHGSQRLNDLAGAFLSDPAGAYIEITEGLDDVR